MAKPKPSPSSHAGAASVSGVPDRKKASVSRSTAGIEKTPENLPVLNALQEFIAAERKKARNRITALTVFFLILIAVTSATGVFVGMVFYRQMQEDIGEVRDDLAGFKSKNSEVTRKAGELVSVFDEESEKLRSDISKNSTALTSMRGDVESQLNSYLARLSSLSETVEGLQEQNRQLSSRLTEIKESAATSRAGVPASRRPQRTAKADNESVGAHARDNRPRAHEASTRPATPMMPDGNGVRMMITPRGSDRQVEWRLPIPE